MITDLLFFQMTICPTTEIIYNVSSILLYLNDNLNLMIVAQFLRIKSISFILVANIP